MTETPWPTAVVSAPPSPSPTPTVTPEEELLAQTPENARGEDFASATQFSRFFFAMYPDLFASDGDTQLFEYLTGENCGFCENAVASVAETRELDAYSVGGDVTFPDVLARGGLQDDGYWYVADRFQAAATETFGPDGELLDAALAYSGEVRFRLEYLDDHWRVDEIDLEFDDA
ncbi:MAG: hypothetical protein CVT68_10770 [Actinobacteria bacterium HGW-Actinobacteria-8]|nr:MAG: hypothetical protein CVT68_10770 [Actinobacteria bacterium HGW-Actinobacteria-8]